MPKKVWKKRPKQRVIRYKRAPSSLNWYKFRMRMAVSLSTGADGAIDARVNVNSLTNHYTPVDGVGALPLLETDQLKGLFDNYRIQAVSIKYTPSYTAPNNIPAVGGSKNDIGGFPQLFMAYDPDNVGGPTSLNKVLTSSRVVQRDLSRSFKKVFKVQRAYQQSQITLANGYNNTQSEQLNLGGVIWIKSDFPFYDANNDAMSNKRIGNLFIETYVEFKNRN